MTANTDQVRVRFKHRGTTGFFSLANRIVDEWAAVLTDGGLAVYVVMARYANNESSEAWMSQQTIADRLHLHRQTVADYLDDIVELGLAERTEERWSDGSLHHTYELLPVGPCTVDPACSPYARRAQARKAKAQARASVDALLNKSLRPEVNNSTRAEMDNSPEPCLLIRQDEYSQEKKTHTPDPVPSGTDGASSQPPEPEPEPAPAPSVEWDDIQAAPMEARAGHPRFANDHEGWYNALIFCSTGWTRLEFERNKPKKVHDQYHAAAKRHLQKRRHVAELVEHYQPGAWWSRTFEWTGRPRPRIDEIEKTWADWTQTPVAPASATADDYAARLRAAEAQAQAAPPSSVIGSVLAVIPPRRLSASQGD